MSEQVADEGNGTPDLRHRQMSVDVHAYLRDRIVSGELAPLSVLSQAEVARSLGLSRGPVREAFRRLQEQGLITAEPNQRPRVAGFDPDSLDSLYGIRIVVEGLGAQVTCAAVTNEIIATLNGLVADMMAADDHDPAWRRAHREFHGTVVSGAGSVVQETTVALAERSEPYYRLYGANRSIGDADHAGIVAAFEARDPDLAMQRHGRHVARTALSVLASMSPEYVPVTIRSSLGILNVMAPDPTLP